ncbi:hypothetical protein [Lacinutrix sp. Bg11-31]|uniref:hypothetical protein n=1 Tax=Lacinutrix sp. Bg11-31 TaxID=2057808 RepID=UPI000C309A07|nr:hypothetical protein [Lacinutrix sp. Bg11-31]AUC81269.1 hypothetical protein CW733_03610 [Lacinutrix sp. Bg11-31]
MKTVLTLFVTLVSLTSLSAQNSIETQSIALDHLITFVANHFPKEVTTDNANTKSNAEDKTKTKQISFILETSKTNFSSEDKIILQQAFKFLTTRLIKEDKVSVFVYSGQNGMLLDRVSAKEIKKMLAVINDVKSSITEKHNDGIAMAYQQAQEDYSETADNMVVMVRNPNVSTNKTETSKVDVTSVKEQITKSKGSNVVLLTAITLLPELISIIKD